ncbi:MAG: Flp pilus assembly complex ATPase component TadA [Polyangiaceae bacterium]|nr:Flp pilus assembly complex ATPase component TadA [Polyangiaceae bacterium]
MAMFSVIISEKGGAERREAFDRTEINVGRVQGNDLMLPKGNVSKRHARLLFRDGRFIVTDLKSTNGTYVNGRKISQATIVREGDKIYIGDFVLRIETGSGSVAPSTSEPPRAPDESSQPREVTAGHVLQKDLIPSPPPLDPPSSENRGLAKSGSPPRVDSPPARSQDIVSHFPLEHDPDDSMQYQVPAPPRVPSGGRGLGLSRSQPVVPVAPGAPTTAIPRPGAVPPPPFAVPATPAPSTSAPPPSPADESSQPQRDMRASTGSRKALVPTPERPADPAQAAAHRHALAQLLTRLGAVVDLSPLETGARPEDSLQQRIDATLGEVAAAMKASGEIPSDLGPELLIATARRELFDLGPFTPLLDDEEVSEVQVVRYDHVIAMHGRRQVTVDLAFSSESALLLALRRMCAMAGEPLDASETFVERRLLGGLRLFAVMPPATEQGHVVVVRKPQRADLTLEDLGRSGTISRAMAGLFGFAVTGRANILVTGSVGAGATSLLGALAAAGSTEDRVMVLEEEDEIIFNQPHVVSMLIGNPDQGVRAVQAAARIHPDRLVVGAFAGRVAVEVVDAIGDGVDGVLAAARAPTLRQALVRLTADIAATRPGIGAETAREWLVSAFDIAVEIARLRDGRHRVMRVAELTIEGNRIVPRDVFNFVVERTAAGGAVEGSFLPTGVVPAVVDDLLGRGVQVDLSMFKRP